MMGSQSVAEPRQHHLAEFGDWPTHTGEALTVVMRDADKEDKIAVRLALHRAAEYVDKHLPRRFGIPALC